MAKKDVSKEAIDRRQARAIKMALSAALESPDEAFATAIINGIIAGGCSFNEPIDDGDPFRPTKTSLAMLAARHSPRAKEGMGLPAIKAMAKMGANWNADFMGKSPMSDAAGSGHLAVVQAMESSGGLWLGSPAANGSFKGAHDSPAMKLMLRVGGIVEQSAVADYGGLLFDEQKALDQKLMSRALAAVDSAIKNGKAPKKTWLAELASAALAGMERSPSLPILGKAMEWVIERGPSLDQAFVASKERESHLNVLGVGHVEGATLGLALAVAAGRSPAMFDKIAKWIAAGNIPAHFDPRASWGFASKIEERFMAEHDNWAGRLAALAGVAKQFNSAPELARALMDSREPVAIRKIFRISRSAEARHERPGMARVLGGMLSPPSLSLSPNASKGALAKRDAAQAEVAKSVDALREFIGMKIGGAEWAQWSSGWALGFARGQCKTDEKFKHSADDVREALAGMQELSALGPEGDALALASLAQWARGISEMRVRMEQDLCNEEFIDKLIDLANCLFAQALKSGLARGEFASELVRMGESIKNSEWIDFDHGSPRREALDRHLAMAEAAMISSSAKEGVKSKQTPRI